MIPAQYCMGKYKSKQKKLHSVHELKKGELQVYGKVIGATGNLRFDVDCQTLTDAGQNRKINVNLAGSSSRKYVNAGMYVLVQMWEFDKNKGTIIHTYEDGEIIQLKNAGYWDYVDSVQEGEEGIIVNMRGGGIEFAHAAPTNVPVFEVTDEQVDINVDDI
jgi:translation initiation factor 1A